jgi:hypothetical protein
VNAAAEWTLSLSLTASEVRVLKAALLVEIATLERYERQDSQPELWEPALVAARRVFSVLCDRGNKQLLDL